MLVCVMGAAGSGKSTMAKRLETLRPELIARVPADFFFIPRPPDQSIEGYLAAPFSYDWAGIDRAVTAAGAERSSPDCDFTTFRRRSPHGGLPIGQGPVLVLDGMRPHPRCDLLVLLQIDAETQQQRLIDRNRQWGAAVATRTEHLAATFKTGITEMPRDPDLVLSATDPMEHNDAAVLQLIRDHLPHHPNL